MQEFKVGRLDALPEECHILASGWSLNESFPLIDRSSVFVMGFNFSFLKCADPDLHFVENASSSNARFFISTMQHYAGLERFKVFESTRLVFKNLSEFKNSINLISWIYGERAEYVRDRHFRFFSRPGLRPTLRSMLREDKCMPQAVSSAVSLIFLARIMGFKKIVMHGLDFYGPHFYGVDLAKAVFGEGLDTSFSSEMEFHKTAVGESGVGTPEVLRELKSLLAEEGIQLMSALKSSPSSEVLGSYYD
ncbi:hypothetical protein D9M71_563370 [compost metagenome]